MFPKKIPYIRNLQCELTTDSNAPSKIDNHTGGALRDKRQLATTLYERCHLQNTLCSVPKLPCPATEQISRTSSLGLYADGNKLALEVCTPVVIGRHIRRRGLSPLERLARMATHAMRYIIRKGN